MPVPKQASHAQALLLSQYRTPVMKASYLSMAEKDRYRVIADGTDHTKFMVWSVIKTDPFPMPVRLARPITAPDASPIYNTLLVQFEFLTSDPVGLNIRVFSVDVSSTEPDVDLPEPIIV